MVEIERELGKLLGCGWDGGMLQGIAQQQPVVPVPKKMARAKGAAKSRKRQIDDLVEEEKENVEKDDGNGNGAYTGPLIQKNRQGL